MSAADRHAATWHGTVGGYVNHGCRCAPCRAAQRAYQQRPEVKATRQAYQQARYREERRLIALARQVETAP